MASPALTISGKVLGKSQNLFTTWQMDLPEQSSTLAELLARIVMATAKAVRTAQRLKSPLVLQSPPTRTQI